MRNVLCVLLAGSGLLACSSGNTGAIADAGHTDSRFVHDGGVTVDSAPPGKCQDAQSRPLSTTSGPIGRKLAGGDNLSVRGVTSDGYVIYSDDAATHLHAVRLPGASNKQVSSTHDLGALGSKFWVVVAGDVVFIWSNVSAADVGALSVWTAQSGLHSIANASFGLLGGVSPDGKKVLFVDGVDSSGTTGDIVLAGVDGGGASKLVSRAHVSGCFPQLGFLGNYAVVTHCQSTPTGSPSATVSSFALDGLRRADLVTHATNYWSAWPPSTEVIVSTSGGVLAVPVGGGRARTIDKTGFIAQAGRDGETVFYSTMLHGFRRSSITSPAPFTLVKEHFGGLYRLSDDDNWVLYYWTMGQEGSDLYLASTRQAERITTLSSKKTATVAGDGFTADSSHAVYVAEVDPCSNSGTLNALALSGGSPVVLGHGAWSDFATGGANVVFTANFVSTGGPRFGRADIEYVDTSKTAAPTVIVEQADAVLGLSPAGDQVVYSWSARSGSNAGVYVTPFPQL